MPLHKLSRGGEKLINSAVDEMFDALKMRAIGQAPKGKKLYVGFERGKSIVGVFEQAAHEEGIPPDIALLDSLTRVAGNYMDAAAARAKAKIGNAVNSWLQETSTKKDPVEPGELREQLKGHLEGLWDELTSAVRTVVDTEATQARNVSWLDGIMRVNAARGIEDPVVFWICVHDDRLCLECKKLHLLEDGVTPRVWRIGEVGHGYHKRGDPNPKIGSLHPNDRCSLVTLLPGFGFKPDGTLGFIAPGHDEYAKQRGEEEVTEKAEFTDRVPEGLEGLTKAIRNPMENPYFQDWFKGSQIVDKNGSPRVLYRGTARAGQMGGKLGTQSFTNSADVGSIYAGTPGDIWSSTPANQKTRYAEGANVFPVHVAMKNPLDLRRQGPQMSFGDYLRAMKYGEPGGMTHVEALKVLNYLAKRHIKHADMSGGSSFKYRAVDMGTGEPYEDLSQLFSSNSPLMQFRDDFDEDGTHFGAKAAITRADHLQADSFAFVDSPRTQPVAERLGHDGVIHRDVFQGVKSAAKPLLGKDPEDVEGIEQEEDELEDGYSPDDINTHTTYRPFHPEHQVRSIFHDHTPQVPAQDGLNKSSGVLSPLHHWAQPVLRFLQTPAAHNLLGSHDWGLDEDEAKDPWRAGGCLTLATALKQHLGPQAEVHSLINNPANGAPYSYGHAVVKYGRHYIDSSGVHDSSSTIPFMGPRVTLAPYDEARDSEALYLHSDRVPGLAHVFGRFGQAPPPEPETGPLHKSSEFDPKTSTWKPLSKEKTYEDPEVQYPVPKYEEHGPAKLHRKFEVTEKVPTARCQHCQSKQVIGMTALDTTKSIFTTFDRSSLQGLAAYTCHKCGKAFKRDQEVTDKSVYDLHQHELDAVKHYDFHKNKQHFLSIGKALIKAVDAKNAMGNTAAMGNTEIHTSSGLPSATMVAYHLDNGNTFISDKAATSLGAMLDENCADPQSYEDHLETLTHEFLHGASHHDHGYTTHQEKALEEASTEILAQHYTPQILMHSIGMHTHLDTQHFKVGIPDQPIGPEGLTDFSIAGGTAGTSEEGNEVVAYPMAYHGFCSRLANLVAYIEGLHQFDPNDPHDHDARLDQAVKHYAWKIKQLPGHLRPQFIVDKLLHKKLGLRAPKNTGGVHPYRAARDKVTELLLENIDKGALARGFLHGHEKKLDVAALDAIVDRAKKAYEGHMKHYKATRKKNGLPEDENEGDFHEAP